MLETVALPSQQPSDSDLPPVQCPPPTIKRVVDSLVGLIAKMGPETEERFKADAGEKGKFCFFNASDPYHPYYQHQLAKRIKEVQYRNQQRVRRMLALVLRAFGPHDSPSIELLAQTHPDIFLNPRLQQVYYDVKAKLDEAKKVISDGTTVNRAMSQTHAPPLTTDAPPLGPPMRTMMNSSVNMIPPLADEPEPKRQRVDDSSFLPQHRGPVCIMVSVPSVDGGNLKGQVLEIMIQSLSETIGSLKEKIAGEIQLPVNKQKLRGRAAFLEDNMSLAHYNIEAGETLALSIRERGARNKH